MSTTGEKLLTQALQLLEGVVVSSCSYQFYNAVGGLGESLEPISHLVTIVLCLGVCWMEGREKTPCGLNQSLIFLNLFACREQQLAEGSLALGN